MLSVLRVHLPSEIPVVGCEITPYVHIRRPDSSISNEDVSEAAPLGGCYMRSKWHRIQSDRIVAVCSIHLTEQATLQCIGCLKAKVPPSKSFHCSPKCFSDAWQHHLVLHDRSSNAAVKGNGIDEEELFGRSQTSSVSSLGNGFATVYPTSITERNGGETWSEVGNSKTYTATAEDIGHVLKFECVPIDAETKLPVGNSSTVTMSRVIPAPSPCPCCMIQVSGEIF